MTVSLASIARPTRISTGRAIISQFVPATETKGARFKATIELVGGKFTRSIPMDYAAPCRQANHGNAVSHMLKELAARDGMYSYSGELQAFSINPDTFAWTPRELHGPYCIAI